MGFMKSYKHLDNLCKDMNGTGITGYIEDMEQADNRKFYISKWKTDYLQLKHYRYIRNQIAHEDYADEDNMCSDQDTAWINEFYQRIMEQTDPLALYYKNQRKINTAPPPLPAKTKTQYAQFYSEPRQASKKPIGYAILLFIAATAAVLMLFHFF